MGEVRDGYNNPATATTQAEKYGAWVRRQEDERAIRRATPIETSSPQIITGGAPSWSGRRSASAAAGDSPSDSSSPGSPGQTGAWIGVVLGLVYGYKPHIGSIALSLYAAVGAALGYASGWILHWVVVIVGKVLAVALKVAAFLFLAWLALQIVPTLLR